ncbi:hypothetical protein HGRIS_000350 [Hohenbuehelia grisea]|uniref:SET domain-containing protein n=1 Tax=Hohenbuehelia grisea TaxID=104357 RepID=A0ABR3JS63_9AGAR
MSASFSQLRAARQTKETKSLVNSQSENSKATTNETFQSAPSDFNANGLYSSLPASIEIKTSETHGRGLWLKEPLKAGTVLINTKPRVAVLSNRYLDSHCSACFEPASPLKRCTQCQTVYYCDAACQTRDWPSHKNECGALQKWAEAVPALDVSVPNDGVRCLARVLWKKQKQGPESQGSREIDSMQNHRPHASSSVIELQTHLAHSLVRYIGATSPPELEAYGISSAADLVNLISRFTTNSFTVTDPTLTPIGVAISPIIALINHSCDPNAVVVFPHAASTKAKEPSMQVIALKDITPGSEILTSYIDTTVPRSLRQKSLVETYHFTCHCDLCTSESATDPRTSMACPKSCGGVCPIPTDEDTDLPRCLKCKAAVSSTDAILDAVRLGKEALEKATSLQLQDPPKARRLTTKLIEILHSAGIQPSSHPLLALSRLQHTLLISSLSGNLTQEALDETIRAINCSVIGCAAVLHEGHPVRAIALTELAKALIVDEPEPRQGPSITYPPSGPARLKLAYDTLLRARHELLIAFGRENEGGKVGRDVRDTLVAVERELGVWKQGIRNTIEDQPVPLKARTS